MSARFCLPALCLCLMVSGSAWAQSPDPAEPQQPVPAGDASEVAATDRPENDGQVDVEKQPSDNPEEGDVRYAQPAFRGLFGPSRDSGGVRRAGNFMASATAAYDHNNANDVTDSGDPRLTESGFYSDVAAGIDYVDRRTRSSFSAYGNTSLSRYEVVHGTQVNANGGIGLTVPVGRNTFRVSQTVSYAPFYQVGLFAALPSAVPTDVNVQPPATDLNVSDLQSLNYTTMTDFSHPVSRRSSVGVFYSFQQTRFQDQPQYDLGEQRAGIRYLHALTPYATLHLEYAYRVGRYGRSTYEAGTQHSHDVIAGVDYGKTLSFSQKTKLTFSTGSSLLAAGNDATVSPSDELGTHVYVTGNVSLVRALSRTWLTLGTYQRSIQFVQGFSQPFLSDAVSVNVSGYVGRSLSLSFDSGYSAGSVGTADAGNSFNSYTASAYAQMAVSRHWAFFGQVLYYHHNFDQGVVLPTGLPQGLDRTGARVGLTTWVPLAEGRK